MGYRVINGKLQYIEGISPAANNIKPKQSNSVNKSGTDFQDILNRQINKNNSFVISKHAEERLKQRNIQFDEADMNQINEGINKAESKGCRDCLICYKGNALVTSIKNRTIITAMDGDSTKGNVFTNIDSVLFI